MQRYLFVDLDDTLFQTRRKCPDDPDLQVRASLADGVPNSYATYKQQWLWEWLAEGFKVVPVTGRDSQAFARVTLLFSEEIVLNHGAVILDKQRKPDEIWLQQILSVLPEYQKKLAQIWTAIEAFSAARQGYKLRLVNDFGITWYGVIKHVAGTETPLLSLLESVIKPHSAIIDGSLYWHLNGNNLAVLPRIINKETAVAYLLERYKAQYPRLLTFAAGDSKTDAPFLALCDYALIPRNTQLGAYLACLN